MYLAYIIYFSWLPFFFLFLKTKKRCKIRSPCNLVALERGRGKCQCRRLRFKSLVPSVWSWWQHYLGLYPWSRRGCGYSNQLQGQECVELSFPALWSICKEWAGYRPCWYSLGKAGRSTGQLFVPRRKLPILARCPRARSSQRWQHISVVQAGQCFCCTQLRQPYPTFPRLVPHTSWWWCFCRLDFCLAWAQLGWVSRGTDMVCANSAMARYVKLRCRLWFMLVCYAFYLNLWNLESMYCI